VGDLFKVFFSGLHINMAGTAGTDTSTVVVEVNIVIFSNLQNGIPGLHIIDDHLGKGGVLEPESDFCHRVLLGASETKVPRNGSEPAGEHKKKPPSAEQREAIPKTN
ncbi:hypothetical protein RZS08_42820, partial [Arthrospira platensis SPKY1]|nr:hypothetical protein [Arthrospira platensis SPKY1]